MLTKIVQKKRLDGNMTMRELSAVTDIDSSLLSKFENGQRIPTNNQLHAICDALDIPIATLKPHWYADKVLKVIGDDIAIADDIWRVAEERIEYLKSKKVLDPPKLDDNILQRLKDLDKLKAEWQSKHPLDHIQLKKMSEYFRTLYTHESNRIEGNTLTLQETELVINQGITISGKALNEHLEAINHAHATDFVTDLVRDNLAFSKRSLLEMHSLILRGIDRNNAGRYRSVPVMISGSSHVPPEPYLLDKLMEDYFINYKGQRANLHPIILAAEMHERLVSIHPFVDGNGRTARLVMNLILLSNGFTIASLKGDHTSRMRYYQSLEAVQVDNEPSKFYHLIMDAVEVSIKEHIRLAG